MLKVEYDLAYRKHLTYKHGTQNHVNFGSQKYVKKVNDTFGQDKDILRAIATNSPELTTRIVDALLEVGIDLSEFIQDSLMTKEILSKADDNHSRSTTPLVVDRKQHIVSPEILGWSIAILASAWSQWVFTSKSNEQSAYQTDKAFNDDEGQKAARKNVKIALPYVRSSIISALDRGVHIGNSSITNFEPKPEIEPQFLELDKDFKS
jgi:hypothetical protein